MKTKPDTDQFKPQKDPMEFLQSGAADLAETIPIQHVDNQTTPSSLTTTKIHREQKIFRLPVDLINQLKREAYEQSIKTGCRVTETELVEQALKKFFIDR